jgi:hypothetical protein
MRVLTRIALALGVVAAVAVTTAGVSSAAPAAFTVAVKHSSGTVATSLSGHMRWSTSLKTVTLTDMSLYVRSGEHATMTFGGYQGTTLVTPLFRLDDQHASTPVGGISLTASVPGGVQHVIIRLYDDQHVISEYANCFQAASVCQYS